MSEHQLCAQEALPEGEARGFEAGGLQLLLVRRAGRVFAYENWCPHRGTTLDWAPDRFLSEDGEHLQCATHGALFRIEDGLCVAGPCRGAALRSLQVELREGQLCVRPPADPGRGSSR